MSQLFESIEEFSAYFKVLWTSGKPLAKLFRTNEKGYLYDTGTNALLSCDDLEFNLLNNLFKYDVDKALNISATQCSSDEFFRALNGIRTLIEGAGILATRSHIRFGGSHFSDLKDMVNSRLGMIQLETTERCNLRCGYCLYDSHYRFKRNHGTRDMHQDIAFKAIDLLAKNSRWKDSVAVTFYGGEPLLRVPFIMSCINYSRDRMKDKEVHFSITTNATLITPTLANYLAEKEINMHVSIDGPQDIHDQYRRDIKGNGSFQRAISGLKYLFDAYGDKRKSISLSMVYAPPYSIDKVERVSQLWDQYPWLPRDIGINISNARGMSTKDTYIRNNNDDSLFEWAKSRYIKDYCHGQLSHPIASSILNKQLVRIVKRPVYKNPLETYCLNGCCIPGSRKLFVSVDGTLSVCERVESVCAIGSVEDGVNFDMLEKTYIKEYADKSIPNCSTCWALQMCSICYVHSFHDGQFDMVRKERSCALMIKRTLDLLILLCGLLEINKTGLDFLTDWKVM